MAAVDAGESSASSGDGSRSASAVNAHHDDVFPLGSIVECVTARGDRMSGEVLCYDSSTRMLVIRHSKSTMGGGGGGKSEMRFINLALVEHVNVLKAAPVDHAPSFPYSNTAQAQERLKRAEHKKKRELLQTKVSVDGQRAFIAIRKTLEETRWESDRIIVFEHAAVVSPYGADCVLPYPDGATPSQAAIATIAHVRKIIDKHSKSVANAASQQQQPSTTMANHDRDTTEEDEDDEEEYVRNNDNEDDGAEEVEDQETEDVIDDTEEKKSN